MNTRGVLYCHDQGPVHPEGHVLIVPVMHLSQGALVDQSVEGKMEDLKMRLRKHALEKWSMDLFVFHTSIEFDPSIF